MILNGQIKHRRHHAHGVERPAEHPEEFYRRLHPAEVEDLRAHLAHRGEEVRHRSVDLLIEPEQKGAENSVGQLRARIAERAAQCIAHAVDDVAQPVKHGVVLPFSQNRPDVERCGQGEQQARKQDRGRGELKLTMLAIIEVSCREFHEE